MSKILFSLAFISLISLISCKWVIDLLPNKEYEIENPVPFKFTEKCKLKYENPSDKLSIKILSGRFFKNFEEFSLNSENFINNENQKKWKGRFTLLENTKIQIKNLGDKTIKLKCKLKHTRKMIDFHMSEIKKFIERFSQKNENSTKDLKISEDVDFNPNAPYEFSNPLFFSVSATCDITAPAPESLFGEVKKGSASINGNEIPKEGMHLTVNNGDQFHLKATAHAMATITNQGDQTVHAKCGLGSNDLKEIEEKYEELKDIKRQLMVHELFFKYQKKNKKEKKGDEEIAFESLKFLSG